MNTMAIRDLIILSAGVGIGAGVTNKIMKAKYEKMMQVEVKGVKEYYEAKHSNDETTADELQPVRKPIKKEGNVTEYNNAIKQYNAPRKTMDGRLPEHNDSPPEDEAMDESMENSYNEQMGRKYELSEVYGEPFVISLQEFTEEMQQFDKLSISYYEGDDTVVDEDEEIIEEPHELLGDGALNCFGEGSEDPDIVYVRNAKLAIDYEVIRSPRTYASTLEPVSTSSPVRRGVTDDDNSEVW